MRAQTLDSNVRPVDPSTGRTLDPSTGQPIDAYPNGSCVHICALSKRWVAISSTCKAGYVCDELSSTQECVQQWDSDILSGRICPRTLQAACVRTAPPP
jgi:hypothetical protein